MQIIRIIVTGLIFSMFAFSISAQFDCNADQLKGYTIDGRDHLLKLEDSNSGKIFLSFFDGFQYRFAICSPTNKKYNIVLYDIEKKMLFSTTCDNYAQQFDFKFKSNINCYIEVTVNEAESKSPQFRIKVGYKEINGK